MSDQIPEPSTRPYPPRAVVNLHLQLQRERYMSYNPEEDRENIRRDSIDTMNSKNWRCCAIKNSFAAKSLAVLSFQIVVYIIAIVEGRKKRQGTQSQSTYISAFAGGLVFFQILNLLMFIISVLKMFNRSRGSNWQHSLLGMYPRSFWLISGLRELLLLCGGILIIIDLNNGSLGLCLVTGAILIFSATITGLGWPITNRKDSISQNDTVYRNDSQNLFPHGTPDPFHIVAGRNSIVSNKFSTVAPPTYDEANALPPTYEDFVRHSLFESFKSYQPVPLHLSPKV